MTIAPIAADDTFTAQQGLLTTTITGHLGADNSAVTDVVDHDPDGTVLGFAALGVAFAGDGNGYLGAFFTAEGVLSFLHIVGTVSYPHPAVFTSSMLTTAQGGTVFLNTTGEFTYQAPAGFSGVDWFDYTLVDVNFNTDTARVNLAVVDTPEGNDRPIAAADVFSSTEDTVITGNLLANNGNGPDSDPNGDALSVNNHTVLTASGGIVSIYANGDFVYTPRAGFSGVDSFSYTLKDSKGASSVGSVTLNVTGINDAPIANNDSFSGVHGKPISGNVLANDTDQDGDTLAAFAATINTASGGLVTLLANGNFTYTPAAKFVGADSFTYTALDGKGGSATATVTLNVTNTGPIARGDNYTTQFGNGLSGNVLANDTDADGDALSVTPGEFTTAQGAKVVLKADGAFTWTPGEAHIGNDSFQYTVSDGFGGTSTATAVIGTATPSGSIHGNNDANSMTGTVGDDTMFGYAEDDTMRGGEGKDTLVGGDDSDYLYGDGGNDTLHGQAGKDTLQGGLGNDILKGGADADTLNGGDGVDWLFGGAGLDRYTGGNGNDYFVFDFANGASTDRVADFKTGDKLAVYASDYGLAAGALPDASYFTSAALPAIVDHGRFIYNSSARSLSWDADGNAATANALIATFDSKVTLSSLDFLVL